MPDGSGRRLGRRARDGEVRHRPGRDLTLSAPKSVSLAGLVGGDGRVVDAHDRAVAATLRWVEHTAGVPGRVTSTLRGVARGSGRALSQFEEKGHGGYAHRHHLSRGRRPRPRALGLRSGRSLAAFHPPAPARRPGGAAGNERPHRRRLARALRGQSAHHPSRGGDLRLHLRELHPGACGRARDSRADRGGQRRARRHDLRRDPRRLPCARTRPGRGRRTLCRGGEPQARRVPRGRRRRCDPGAAHGPSRGASRTFPPRRSCGWASRPTARKPRDS